MSSLLQDAEDWVIGRGFADVLQDLVYSWRVWSAWQNHPLLILRTNVHSAADSASPAVPLRCHSVKRGKKVALVLVSYQKSFRRENLLHYGEIYESRT